VGIFWGGIIYFSALGLKPASLNLRPDLYRTPDIQSKEGGFNSGALSKMESTELSSLRRLVKKAKLLFPKPRALPNRTRNPSPSAVAKIILTPASILGKPVECGRGHNAQRGLADILRSLFSRDSGKCSWGHGVILFCRTFWSNQKRTPTTSKNQHGFPDTHILLMK
jgi:hypothetical protein